MSCLAFATSPSFDFDRFIAVHFRAEKICKRFGEARNTLEVTAERSVRGMPRAVVGRGRSLVDGSSAGAARVARRRPGRAPEHAAARGP